MYEKLPFIFIFVSFLFSHIKSPMIWNFFLVVPNVFFCCFFVLFCFLLNMQIAYILVDLMNTHNLSCEKTH